MDTIMRAKFQVSSVLPNPWGDHNMESFIASAVYSDDPSNPNHQWSQATPSGTLQLLISNPAAQGKLKVGQQFFIDLIAAE